MPLRRKKTNLVSSKPKLVIGIGASAGGVKVLKKLVPGIAAIKRDVTIILIQHMDETGNEIAIGLLKSLTSNPVREIVNGVRLESGSVYWAPPHTLVNLEKGIFKTLPARTTQKKLSVINHLFSSLGNEFGPSTVGVLLSGEGTDGAIGIKEINEAGGLTIVQSPESAEHTSMPESAIATGAIDHILEPSRIPDAIERNAKYLLKVHAGTSQASLKDQIAASIVSICEILLKKTQHDFKHYKSSTLIRRIQRRMQVLRIDSVEAYIERLTSNKDEVDALFKELLINVTSFFRDKPAFEALKTEVLEKLVASCKPGQKLRVWTAGCSSGEEPYSVAILLSELIEKLSEKPEIQILATDIDPHALNSARRGSYPLSIADQVPQEYLTKYFTKRGGRYHVSKVLREKCLFSIHNLINDPPFSQIDLILCRNVLIYLGSHLQKKLFPVFHYALKPNGFLFLGTSESITSHRELFKPIDTKNRIVQRKAIASQVPKGFPGSINNYLLQFQESAKDTDVNLSLIGQRIALDEIPLKYAIVNDEGHIISASSGLGKYVEIPEGRFQNSLVKLTKPSLRSSLRKAFTLAKREKRKVVDENSTLKSESGFERVGIIVQPMPQLGEETGLYWIAFQYLGSVAKVESEGTQQPVEVDQDLVDQLEKEVFVLREDLEKAIQDLEATNEELKSSNEELLSMNEELQTANEELETSKEEIQLANEALQRANADLENLLAGTQIATLFLDDELRIRGFTPSISAIYRIKSSDVGRDIRDYTSYAIEMPPYPNPKLDSLHEFSESEVRTQSGTIYQRRILPYRNQDNANDGIVVTFIDVTQLRLAEMQYRELADSMPNIIWTTDADGVTDYLNERWYTFTGFDRNLRGQASWLPILHPDDAERCLEIRRRSYEAETPFEMEYRFWDRKQSTYRWFLGRAMPVKDEKGKIKKWVGSAVDIHDRVVAEEARRESEKRFQLMADTAPVLVWISGKDKTRTWFNKGWFDFTGQSMAEALVEGWRDCVHPDDLPRYVDIYETNFEKQSPFYIEYRLKHHSGSYRWIGARGVPRLSADGVLEGYIGACLDIHEQKIAREELAENRASLDLMIRTSPSFMCVLKGPNHVIELANDQYHQLVGHRSVIGKPILEAIPEVRDQGFIELLDRVRSTGEPFVGNEVSVMLERQKGASPERRFLDFVYQPHEKKNGQIESIFVHGVDVTEKVLVRVAIENERANFRNLFKQTPEMVCILRGPDHVFEFVNEAHVRALGFDATGKSVREAQPESVEVHGILDDVACS